MFLQRPRNPNHNHVLYYNHESWALWAQGPTLMYNHECFYKDPVTLITWTLSLSLGPGPAGLRPSCLCLKENKKALGQVGLGPGPGPEALFLLLLPKTTKHWAWTLGLGLGPGPAGLWPSCLCLWEDKTSRGLAPG